MNNQDPHCRCGTDGEQVKAVTGEANPLRFRVR